MKYRFLLISLITVTLFACSKHDKAEQSRIDDALIQQYFIDHNITDAESTNTGLYFRVTKDGTGIPPFLETIIKVEYKGYLIDGTVFEDFSDNAINIPLKSTIDGWQQGLQAFNRGSEGQLFIPSSLAYGRKKQGDIPAYSVLIFDIELIDY